METEPDTLTAPAVDLSRSPRSFEFEARWRSLRTDGLVPSRNQFHPSRIRSFLPDMTLLEVLPDAKILKIRLAGTRVERRVQRPIQGANYLDFLPERYREGALMSAQLTLDQPCGLWQAARIHYERGTVVMMEQTIFPLRPSGGLPPMLLVYARPIAGGQEPTLKADKPLMADTATKYAFLDVGAGIPD